MIVAIVVVAVFTVACVLIILALMREIVLLRGDVTALSQLITKPPTPSVIGGRLPESLLAAVHGEGLSRQQRDALVTGRATDMVIVMFMSETCESCEELTPRRGTRHVSPAALSGESEPPWPVSPVPLPRAQALSLHTAGSTTVRNLRGWRHLRS